MPAKSGVSGCILLVLPREKLGFCIYSPRLDAQGNSVRGLKACQIISKFFSAHIFNNLTREDANSEDLASLPYEVLVARMLTASAAGDIETVSSLIDHIGTDAADYDQRRGIHLACSEVEFLPTSAQQLSVTI